MGHNIMLYQTLQQGCGYPTPRIALLVRPSRFVPYLTRTIVWCVSVSNGMEVYKVTEEVADEVADVGNFTLQLGAELLD